MSIRHRIDIPHRGFGRSLGNMLETLSGEALEKQDGNWIEVEESEPGEFDVVADNMTSGTDWITDATALGFIGWDEEVENLDTDSDAWQCFGMSCRLKWKNVEMTPYTYIAPSVERLREAFQHVAVCAWCPGDI